MPPRRTSLPSNRTEEVEGRSKGRSKTLAELRPVLAEAGQEILVTERAVGVRGIPRIEFPGTSILLVQQTSPLLRPLQQPLLFSIRTPLLSLSRI